MWVDAFNRHEGVLAYVASRPSEVESGRGASLHASLDRVVEADDADDTDDTDAGGPDRSAHDLQERSG